MNDQELEEIVVLAERRHPGRSWRELSPEEQQSIFKDYANQKQIGFSMINGDVPQGRHVGPLGVYVAPNAGEMVAHAVNQFAGHRMLQQANKGESDARKVASELLLRRDSLDDEARHQERMRRERERRMWAERGVYQ